MRKLLTATGLALATFAVVSILHAAEPKSVKQVMQEAHKGEGDNPSLFEKVAAGKAEKAEVEKLVALYKDLAASKPKKGDEKVWKEKTAAMLKAAQEVLKGDAAAGKRLSAAGKCKTCHDLFKEDD
jgi:RNA polymerase-interacting CarD/CdnL/TRCF family regulator